MSITLTTPNDTLDWGRKLAGELRAGDVVALCGQLGAGKTQATKGLVLGLGSEAPVTSPTFTLLHEYSQGRLPVFHFDFYRMEAAEEVLTVGWDDILDEPGVVIVEWADLFPELLPAHTRWFQFTTQPDGSRLVQALNGPPPAAQRD